MVVACLTVVSAASRWADPSYTVEYPQGYRQWTHVMSYVIGVAVMVKDSQRYTETGGWATRSSLARAGRMVC